MSFVPTPRLITLVAALALAAALAPAVAPWGLATVILLALADYARSRHLLAALTPGPVEPIRTYLGVPTTLTIPLAAPPGARLSLALPPELELTDEASLPWLFTPRERGRYAVIALAVQAPSSLGLWELRRLLTPAVEIRVYPRVRGTQEMSALLRALSGSRHIRQVGRGREFEKLREYSPGDSFQDVHWKATARRGAPITRTYQLERTQEIYCLLDCGRLQARRQDGQTVLDWSLTAALHLALAAERQGDRFGLVAFSDRIEGFARPSSGAAHFAACQDILYPLRPAEAVTDYAELATYLRPRLPRRALLILFTSLDDQASAEPFLRAVRLLAQRHLVAIVAARAPGAEPLFSGPPAPSEEAIYSALGGHLVWRGLRQLQLDLQHQGLRLAFTEPREMGLRALSLYEEIRQRQLV
jgi:uncharacterized protein (DUF58 family)